MQIQTKHKLFLTLSYLAIFASITSFAGSIVQDYLRMAVLHWKQGLIPWLGYDLFEMPFGIFTLSNIFFINNLFVQNLSICFVYLVNGFLLAKLLKRNGISSINIFKSLIFYIIGSLSLANWGITLEPFAVFFILLAYTGLQSHKKKENTIAGILISIAVFFKIQVVFLIPCLTILILLPSHTTNLHFSRFFSCIFIIFFNLFIFYMGITIWSENAEWITYVRLNLVGGNSSFLTWGSFITSTGTLFLYVPIRFWSLFRGKKKNLIISAFIGSLSMLILVIIGADSTCLQLLLVINTIAVAANLEIIGDKKCTKVLYIICITLSLTMSGIRYIDNNNQNNKDNPVLKSFNVNYQLQQEVKAPTYEEKEPDYVEDE